jgi:hypothetical protein
MTCIGLLLLFLSRPPNTNIYSYLNKHAHPYSLEYLDGYILYQLSVFKS